MCALEGISAFNPIEGHDGGRLHSKVSWGSFLLAPSYNSILHAITLFGCNFHGRPAHDKHSLHSTASRLETKPEYVLHNRDTTGEKRYSNLSLDGTKDWKGLFWSEELSKVR